MDTKREGPEVDEISLFIAQCEAVRVGVSERAISMRGRPVNFGKGGAVELLWAIGRYAVENGLEVKAS